jgi:hypothetical protein
MKELPKIIWIDNFSKTVARQHPDMATGVWTPCLWTGVAFKDLDLSGREPIYMSCQFVDEVRVSAMPKNLFDDDGLLKWLAVDYDKVHLFDSCLATLYNVRNIPPKVDMSELTNPSRRVRLMNSRDGLSRMHNHNIIEYNIGSNIGLMNVIKYIMADEVLSGGQGYMMVNADIQIFERLLKVPFLLLIIIIYVP